MLVIRFNRVGRKNYAQYRIVVQEKTMAPSGKHVAVVGSYDPHTKEAVLKAEEIKTYISNGAQPSDSVYNLLVREGVIEGEKRFVKVPEKKVEQEETKEEGSDTEEQKESEKAEEAEETKESEKAEDSADATEEKDAEQSDATSEETTSSSDEVAKEEAPKEEVKDVKEEAKDVEEEQAKADDTSATTDDAGDDKSSATEDKESASKKE